MAKKQLPTTSKAPRSGSSDDTLKKVMGMVNLWLDFRKKLLPLWERDLKLYNNERYKKHYEGVADTFVPMTYSTLESISAALLTADFNTDFIPQDIYEYLKDRLKPGFTGQVEGPEGEMIPETEEEYLIRSISTALEGGAISDESLDVLNAFYDYLWESGNWEDKIGEMIDSGLQIGNGALWMVFENNKPKLISVPFPDYVFDPRASEDEAAEFGGRRYLASIKDLRAETIVDPETRRVKKRYNLSGLKKRTSNKNEQTEKELMEQMLFGSTVEIKNDKGELKDDLDQCEVIELRTRERAYTIVNRSCVAEDVENPILAQAKLRGIEDTDRLILIPGITWANNKKGSLLIGKSETSTFWQEQERLNDATNQKSDAVTRALLQNYRADPVLKPQSESFSVPGSVIWSQPGQYEAISPAQVPGEAFAEEASIKNNIRETTATDQIVKGVGSTSDVTATEANLQVAQSGQRIEKKIKKLESGPLKRVALLALQYIRLFITDPFIIPQQVNDGIKPLLYNPSQYNFDFEPKVTLTIAAQNRKKMEQSDNIEAYKLLIADPTNNLTEVKKLYLPKVTGLDSDEVERIASGEPAMQNQTEELPPEMAQELPQELSQ